MDDLISRQAALKALEPYLDEYSQLTDTGLHDLKWCAMMEAIDIIKELPSVQPEPYKEGE